jgi:hypothetical protein
MSVSRLFGASALILGALALPTSAATMKGPEVTVAGQNDGGIDDSLVARANTMLPVNPSPEDVSAALEAAGASDVNVGQPVSGSTVVNHAFAAGRTPPSKDDATPTINEEAMQTLDASPTSDELKQALVDAGATDVSVSSMQFDTARHAETKVPADAFNVSSLWADYTGSSGKKHVVFYGFWNFRDEFIGSGDPNDGSAVQLDGFSANCWTKVSADVLVKDYQGNAHGHGIMQTDTHQKSIFAVDDRTEDFMMLTDNGIHAIDMRRDKIGCDARRAGSYFYEHNQDGGGGWSASLSMAIFSISYSGSSGSTLQKAATFAYYN